MHISAKANSSLICNKQKHMVHPVVLSIWIFPDQLEWLQWCNQSCTCACVMFVQRIAGALHLNSLETRQLPAGLRRGVGVFCFFFFFVYFKNQLPQNSQKCAFYFSHLLLCSYYCNFLYFHCPACLTSAVRLSQGGGTVQQLNPPHPILND